MGLGVLSILALAFSHLALTDIWHGEGDLALEWNILRVAALILAAFIVIALVTFFRALFSVGLGVLSILALAFSHLALTDIWHGEGDLALEWNILRVAALILAAFIVIALVTFFRALRITRELTSPDGLDRPPCP